MGGTELARLLIVNHLMDSEKIAKLLEGLLVLGCLPNSPAAQSGLRYGDIVTRVNGMPTKTLDDFYRARSLRQSEMTLYVFREGRFVTLSVAIHDSHRTDASDLEEYVRRKRPLPGLPGHLLN